MSLNARRTVSNSVAGFHALRLFGVFVQKKEETLGASKRISNFGLDLLAAPAVARRSGNSAWLTFRQVRYKVTQLQDNGCIKGELPFRKSGVTPLLHAGRRTQARVSVTRTTGLPRPLRPHSWACPVRVPGEFLAVLTLLCIKKMNLLGGIGEEITGRRAPAGLFLGINSVRYATPTLRSSFRV